MSSGSTYPFQEVEKQLRKLTKAQLLVWVEGVWNDKRQLREEWDELIAATNAAEQLPDDTEYRADAFICPHCKNKVPTGKVFWTADIVAKLDELFDLIQRRQFREARDKMAALEGLIGPQPELTRAGFLLHRGEP